MAARGPISPRSAWSAKAPAATTSISAPPSTARGSTSSTREDLDHAGIVAALDPVFAAYAGDRQKGERFGDFTIRAGFVAATGNGRDFHANVGKQAERAGR